MVRKFNKAALALMVLAGSIGMAYAAGPIGTVQTKTADVAFAQPEGVSHILTVQGEFPDGITAGDTLLAFGEVDTLDGAEQYLAIRFTPGTTISTDRNNARIAGQLDPDNTIYIKYQAVATGQATIHGNVDVTNNPVSQYQYRLRTHGSQNVSADIYVASMDASLWAN